MSYGVKSKDCKKCSLGQSRDEHECIKNFSGSAKAMEPALATDMLEELKGKGCIVDTIIMDDDTSTLSRINQNFDENMKKRSDKNHTRKNITSDLYKLKLTHSSLNKQVIDYFTMNAQYAMSQCHEKAEELAGRLNSIVPHAFGEHNKCHESWCKFIRNPENYQHQYLPGGKDLSDPKLRADLSKLFERYASNAEKLANLGSSLQNESFNQMVSSKAPKAKHFGGSESLNIRVAASAAQVNDGRSYIVKVFEFALAANNLLVFGSPRLAFSKT